MVSTKQKFAMITQGCPKNEVDSGVLAGELVRGGMNLVRDIEQADIILINTCGFIEDAKKESIDNILLHMVNQWIRWPLIKARADMFG